MTVVYRQVCCCRLGPACDLTVWGHYPCMEPGAYRAPQLLPGTGTLNARSATSGPNRGQGARAGVESGLFLGIESRT